MVRTILLGASAAFIAFAPAFAQGQGAAAAPAPGEMGIDEEFDEPPSELDILSRTEDKSFPELEETLERRPVSVTVRALNKITARYIDIETPIGEPAKFGSLEILPRYCDKRPPEEFPETSAFLEIFDRDVSSARAASSVEARPLDASDIPAQGGEAEVEPVAAQEEIESPAEAAADPDRIFSGWMFASSPALNPLEHAVYDVWVIDCKTEVVDN